MKGPAWFAAFRAALFMKYSHVYNECAAAADKAVPEDEPSAPGDAEAARKWREAAKALSAERSELVDDLVDAKAAAHREKVRAEQLEGDVLRAQATVLEQETRSANAEAALERVQDEAVTLRHVVAGSVPVADLKALLKRYPDNAYVGLLSAGIGKLITAAEQRAAVVTPAPEPVREAELVGDAFVTRETQVPAAPSSKLTILGTPVDIMRGNAAEEWVFSEDEEHFGSDRYPSADAAFAAWQHDQDPAPGDRVFIGRAVEPLASEFARFDVDSLSEAASDENEHADGWPDSTPEQNRELEAMVADAVDAWADKHGLQPKFYTVEDMKIRTFEPDAEEGGDA